MEQLYLIQPDSQRSTVAGVDLTTDEDGNIISILDIDNEDEESDYDEKKDSKYLSRFDRTRDEAFSYLQEIARTPLLTAQKERDLFSLFRNAKECIDEILNNFPKVIIDEVSRKKKRRGAKRKDKRWWNSMNIPIHTNRIWEEIEVAISDVKSLLMNYQQACQNEDIDAIKKLSTSKKGILVSQLAIPHQSSNISVKFLTGKSPSHDVEATITYYDEDNKYSKFNQKYSFDLVKSTPRGRKAKEKKEWKVSNVIADDARQDEGKIDKKSLKNVWNELIEAGERLLEVKEKLVEANLLLVASIAKRHNFHKTSLSFLDLMQEGSIGLMKAIDKFDLEKGYRFSTYATWWIMQTIKRALDQQSETIRIPCYIGETRRSIKHAMTDLAKELEREPDIREVAEEVGIAEDRVVEILQSAKRTISLDMPLSEAISEATISDFIADESKPLPEELLISNAKKELLDQVLGTLKEREVQVIKFRYGLEDGTEHTLAEIGKVLGISRERVRQIESEALRKLRHPTRKQNLAELLK